MVGQGTAEKLDVLTKRLDVLDRLTDGAAYKRDLVDDLDHSRSTINRAIDELSAVDLVRRTDDGFTATMAGRLALDRLDEFRRDLDDVVDAETVLEPLPSDALLDVAAVAGSRVLEASEPAPYRPLEAFHDDLEAAGRYRALLPSLDDPRQVRLLYEHVVIQDRPAELVVSPEVFGTLRSEFPRRMAAMAESEGFTLLVGEPPVFALALVESGTTVEPTTTVYVVVFAESGAVHGSLANESPETVSWATELYDSVRTGAEDRTEELTENATGGAAVLDDDRETIRGGQLPVALEREGFVRLGPSYFRAESVGDPTTAWRTGLTLAEVHTGYAVERTIPADSEQAVSPAAGLDEEGVVETTVADLVSETLVAGRNSVVVGPPGSGKSTVAKRVACAWYDADRGPVLYRESGRGRAFDSVDAMVRTLEHGDGHALVVVEDATRPEAARVFDLLDRVADRGDVSVLLDSRAAQWHNPSDEGRDDLDVAVVTMPPLHEADTERLVSHFERTTGESIDVPGEQLRVEARTDDAPAAGEVLLLLHRLATYADPLAEDATSLEESVAGVYREFAHDDLALDVCVLANALNATGVGVDRGLLYAVADPSAFDAVDSAIDRLEGRVLFPDDGSYRTVHESWSVAFLTHLSSAEDEAIAAERFGDCLTALLGLADDPARRDHIARHLEREALDEVVAEPGDWADSVAEATYRLGQERPKLAPLFGSGQDNIALPAACSDRVDAERPIWLGRLFLAAGRYDDAEWAFDRLSADGGEAEFERLLGLSEVAENRGEYDDAVAHAETALELAGDLDDAEAEGRAELRLGQCHVSSEAYDTARPLLRRALDRFDEAGDDRRTATVLDELGVVARRLVEYEPATEYHRRSLELSREHGDRRGQADSHQHLGSVFLDRTEFDAAREQYERSLDLYRHLGDRASEAGILENLGLVARHQGEYEDAKAYHERSLAVSEELGETHGRARSLGNLGLLAKKENRYDDAIGYYEQSLDLHRELGLRHGEAKAAVNLAEVAVLRGDVETTQEYAEQARVIFDELDDQKGKAITANILAAAHREEGDLDSAATQFRRSLELFRSAGIPQGLGVARRNLGEILEKQGDDTAARDHWRDALETFEECDAPQDALETLELLVEHCRAVGDEGDAREWHRRARELLARVPDSLASQHREWVERNGEELEDE